MTLTRRIRTALRIGERGSVSLENAILWPVLLVAIFGFIQFGLWLHARDLAHGAATAAYHAARTLDGSSAAGQAAGYEIVNSGNGSLTGATVAVSRSPQTVVVTVTGTAPLLIAGFPGTSVSETVTGPVERYVAP